MCFLRVDRIDRSGSGKRMALLRIKRSGWIISRVLSLSREKDYKLIGEEEEEEEEEEEWYSIAVPVHTLTF